MDEMDGLWRSHPCHGKNDGGAWRANWLSEVRSTVEAEGDLTEAAVQKLAAQFGGKPNSLVLSLEAFRKESDAEGDDGIWL